MRQGMATGAPRVMTVRLACLLVASHRSSTHHKLRHSQSGVARHTATTPRHQLAVSDGHGGDENGLPASKWPSGALATALAMPPLTQTGVPIVLITDNQAYPKMLVEETEQSYCHVPRDTSSAPDTRDATVIRPAG